MTNRSTIFISHATPSDNDFTIWLASRLSMAGYEVWCDANKLIGGEDFWRDIERALRQSTIKFILVMSEKAFLAPNELRAGIADEVALAKTVQKENKIDNFIVPMRIDKVLFSDFPIDFHRLNGIDCSDNWASGLVRLLKVLERDSVPKIETGASDTIAHWRIIHQHRSKALSADDETLQTNWLGLVSMPATIYAYEILRPVKFSEPRSIASACSLPCTEHARLLLSFASFFELQDALGQTIPIKQRAAIAMDDFLRGKVGDLPGLKPGDAKNKMSSLIRQGIERVLVARDIQTYAMANGLRAYWFLPGAVPDDKLRYLDYDNKRRRRAVIGVFGKKKDEGEQEKLVTRYYWHLGFTIAPVLAERPSLWIKPRVIVTDDMRTPLANKVRLNAARRSITKRWFNERWRGFVMGIGAWLADGDETFIVPMGGEARFVFNAQPETLIAPISISADPASSVSDDEQLAAEEEAEFIRKTADPAFHTPDNDEVDEYDEA